MPAQSIKVRTLGKPHKRRDVMKKSHKWQKIALRLDQPESSSNTPELGEEAALQLFAALEKARPRAVSLPATRALTRR